jgi:hypothetical protein
MEGVCHSSGANCFQWSVIHPKMFAISSKDPFQKSEAVKVYPNAYTKGTRTILK